MIGEEPELAVDQLDELQRVRPHGSTAGCVRSGDG